MSGVLLLSTNNGDRALERIAYLATIVIAFVTIMTLPYIVLEFQSSNVQLNKTIETTNALQDLINTSNEQLNTLNKVITQISHQTIMQAYLDGAPFSVAIPNCSYDEENKKVNYKIVTLDQEGTLTPIQFIIVRDFGYYTTIEENGKHRKSSEAPFLHEKEEVIEPGQEKIYELSLSDILNETKNSNDLFLYVRSQYAIAPYSEATSRILTDYVPDQTGHLIIGFKKNEITHDWEMIRDNQNTACK